MTIIACASVDSEPAECETIYLAAPITTYNTKRYRKALNMIKERHLDAGILDAATLFAGPEDWLQSYEQRLASVTLTYILPDPHGYVGKGVYTEWLYLESLGATIIAFLPNGCEVQTPRLRIVSPDSWRQYAMVLPPKLPFGPSSTFALVAEAAFEYPDRWRPMREDELTGELHLIPRDELYQAVIERWATSTTAQASSPSVCPGEGGGKDDGD